MAGFLEVGNESALDWFKTFRKLRSNDNSFDLELGLKGSLSVVEEGKFRCLFHQILLEFLKSSCGGNCFRPVPPMLGNGQSVNLLKLYLLVREKGGYEIVSLNGLWGLVAEESGFSPCVGSALKIVYSKYLGKLDLWSQKIVNDKDLKGALEDMGDDKGCRLMDLDTDVSEVVSGTSDQKKEDCEYLNTEVDTSCLDAAKVVDNSRESGNSSDLVGEEDSNRKRKRECDEEMLSWIVNVAKDPCNPGVGSLPEKSKWKHYGENVLWKQVLLARELMFSERNVNSDANPLPANWGKRPMHPSMYEDNFGSERVRTSRRIIPPKELSSKPRASSESSSGTRSDIDDDFGKNTEELSSNSVFFFLHDAHSRKRVPVGPYFQAHVPECTEETYTSDAKWLGTHVWPLENEDRRKYLVERDPMGKGRQDSCGCQYKGSVECVRFHIAEKRMRVKLELGSAFFHWKLDKMGEEVAVSWTKQEEEKFQGVIQANPLSLQKCFWDELVKVFPCKKREELVSYYYNVFLLRRRSYQNRSSPGHIDSDDEESEFGSLTDSSRPEAGKSPSSIFYSPKKAHLSS